MYGVGPRSLLTLEFDSSCHSSVKRIFFSLITFSTNGYDSSMMNGLQSFPQWESAFGYPSGGKLGLLNTIQVSFFCTCADDLY
ncbi:hypothetical protein EV424DRAFT_1327770 [Suillus variegatus]|nr:hypothetical protein EV424DRAFT_1327770 [Suillus variegatus]